MQTASFRTTVVFVRPFRLSGLDEDLPAGEYDVETEVTAPHSAVTPQAWRASVMLHLKPRFDHPGLDRTLAVPLAELERAEAEDRLTGQPLAELLLDKMLADPMVRIVMGSDGVSDDDMRRLYSGSPASGVADDPIDLDQRRSPAGQIAADIRRHAHQGTEHDRETARRRQEDLEAQLAGGPAETWTEAASAAAYLIRRYALTPDAQDARLARLIDRALGDLARLADREARR